MSISEKARSIMSGIFDPKAFSPAKTHDWGLDSTAAKDKSSGKGGFIPNSVLSELLTSGASVGTANVMTSPLDVIKVRMQLESNLVANTGSGIRTGMASTGLAIVRNEGITVLWSGLGPTIARGFFFGGARLGLYTPIKSMICGEEKPTLAKKIMSGSLSGGLAAAVTSPIELIKTRLQAAGRTPGAATTSIGVVRSVVSADGVTGLWRGALPGLVRSAILTAAQCATYDEVKRTVIAATGWKQNDLGVHLSSSMIAGLITTTVTNPVDVIKTRMFMGGRTFRGPIDCAASVFAKDGLRGFMKGWSASYTRLGPHTVIMFLTAEKLRAFAGLQGL